MSDDLLALLTMLVLQVGIIVRQWLGERWVKKDIKGDVAAVHTLVNSKHTEALATIVELKAEIVALKKQLADALGKPPPAGK